MPSTTRPKRVLAETEPDSQNESAVRKKLTRAVTAADDNASSANASTAKHPKANPRRSKTAKASKDTDPRTWICLCEMGVRHDCRISPKCMCMRYADANPGQAYVVTKRGEDLFREWRVEQLKRDADVLGVIAFNDYSGYGTGEVVENMLCAYDDVLNAEDKDIWRGWAHVEGMARFLSQDHSKWSMIDNPDGNAKLVMLIGTAVLTAIDHLSRAGLFRNESVIQNIGFVLGLFLEFVVEFEDICNNNEDGWRFAVVKKADEHGVVIHNSWRMSLILQKVRADIEDEDDDEEGMTDYDDENAEKTNDRSDYIAVYKGVPYNFTSGMPSRDIESCPSRSWNAWDWKQELNAYSIPNGHDGKIGGNYYDLTVPHSDDDHTDEEFVDSFDSGSEAEKPVAVPD